jgi:hypothetical protein
MGSNIHSPFYPHKSRTQVVANGLRVVANRGGVVPKGVGVVPNGGKVVPKTLASVPKCSRSNSIHIFCSGKFVTARHLHSYELKAKSNTVQLETW